MTNHFQKDSLTMVCLPQVVLIGSMGGTDVSNRLNSLGNGEMTAR